MHLRQLELYHIQERCENWSVNGYLKGVVYRYPLLDIRIIEYMLKIPSEILCESNYYRPILRIMGEGILSEEVWLHQEKIDPVCWAFMKELYKEAASYIIEDADKWRSNPDMFFLDLDRLAEDIRKYKSHSGEIKNSEFFWAIVYLEGINRFTLQYRKNGTKSRI
jgi:hypothetical protein